MDKEVILRHLENMESALTQMRAMQSYALEEVKNDLLKQWQIEKGFEVLIQNLLDIGSHILVSRGISDWEDYADVIIRMGEHGIIPLNFSQRIAGMANFRNILIHEYTDVDIQTLVEYLREKPADFEQFMVYIHDYLEKEI